MQFTVKFQHLLSEKYKKASYIKWIKIVKWLIYQMNDNSTKVPCYINTYNFEDTTSQEGDIV